MRDRIRWDPQKQQKLLAEKDLSFWLVVEAIEKGAFVADIEHPDLD